MVPATSLFLAKSQAYAELPEDHCGDQEAPEQFHQQEDEVTESYEN